MIETRVTAGNLEIEVTGLDGVLVANRTRWTFSTPVGDVLRARPGPPLGFGQRRHVNFPGSERRHYSGRLVCAHFRAPVLRVELDTYPYHELILSVPDPGRAAEEITRALSADRR